MRHHPVFEEFTQFGGVSQAGHMVDFIGSTINEKLFSGYFPEPHQASLPSLDEEYFEWIDILRSVAEARDEFVFVELGAGYGRWTARAFKAAEQKGLRFRASLVEGEPVHAKWAHMHMQANDVPNYLLHEAVVGPTKSKTMFVVEKSDKSFDDSPAAWYGQALGWFGDEHNDQSSRLYEGRPIIERDGWGMIEVPVESLAAILGPYDFVNLIDMDIQGAEADLIDNSKDVLRCKVHRVHIGTHSHEIEDRIRSTMTGMGWIKEWDFPCLSETETPYGLVNFGDGVQSWTNPARDVKGNPV